MGDNTGFFSRLFRHSRPSLANAESALAEGHAVRAAALFRACAEAGTVEAQLRLADLYRSATGVPQDYVEAVRWLRAAAEQGSPRLNLGSARSFSLGARRRRV
ncbi:MAG: SEL1-like repeat protein [Rhodospirillales bacterium]|nr:SEL1-like repeat protein [Rhodospirillales bacterium]